MAGEFVAGGRAVAAERGWAWIASGWRLFAKQPWTWIALVVILLLIFLLLAALVPVVGRLIVIGLSPIFLGGLALGCRAQDEGGALRLGHLFAGFRQRLAELAAIGAISAGAAAVIALAAVLGTGINPFAARTAAELAALSPADLLAIALVMLIIAALLVPVAMAAWFAPPLVLFHGRGAVPAMKESFAASWTNVMPFTVYGIIALGLGFAACIPIFLGLLVLFPVLAASAYTSYKDIFTAE